MRKILFKDNFLDVNEEYLQDLKNEFYMALGAYKQKLLDVSNISPNHEIRTETEQVIKLVTSMLAKRSTVGTEELEGYTPDINKLEKNLKENKLDVTDESNVALDILKSYLSYELPVNILDKSEIKAIHTNLFKSNKERYKPGRFRKNGDNNVKIESSQKEFIDSKLVDKHMDKFILYFNSSMNLDTITKAAMIHGILLGIHPFKDGNGRTTRFITDKFISKELQVPLYLSEAINGYSDNTEYTTALDQFHLELNSLPLIRFFYQVTINQLRTNTNLIDKWIKKIYKTADILSKREISSKYIDDLALLLSESKYIYQKQIAGALGVTTVTAATLINKLIAKDVIGNSKLQGRITIYEVNI